MFALILLCCLCVDSMQILALPSPQLVYSDPNLCSLCSEAVSVVPVVDPNSDHYLDSLNYPIVYDDGPQPIPYVWPEQGITDSFSTPQVEVIPDYYFDKILYYDPVEDVVRATLSQLVQISVNADDFAQRENDFLNRFVDPYIV